MIVLEQTFTWPKTQCDGSRDLCDGFSIVGQAMSREALDDPDSFHVYCDAIVRCQEQARLA